MRTWSVFGGRFLGVEFRLHITFLFLLAFALKPYLHSGDSSDIGRGFAFTALALASVFLHEMGHVLAAARLGQRIKGIILLPVGGVTVAEANQPEDPRAFARSLRIAAAGSMVNLFLASASGLILLAWVPPERLWEQPWIDPRWLSKSFFWMNLFLVGVNLLPAFPLDAGRVLRDWLAQRMDYNRATRRAVNLGHLIAGALILAGMASEWLMLAGFVLFMATQMEERTAMFHSVAETVQMEDIMLTHFSTLSPADTLEDALSKAVHSLQDDFPVVSGSDLVGVINRQTIVERLRREGNGYVQGAMNKAFEIAARTESLASAFRKLTARGLTLIPVVDQERLVGIVTLQNLMHSMGLLAESRRLRKRMEEGL
ncbi:MAG TPA: site-2 protease family protein [Candidatus Angelobacter sp.]|nr:site-2 protease family protein [Candidatus Angelobacter sp.]